MSLQKIKQGLVFLGTFMMVFICTSSAQNLQLYTTFPKISVAAGEIVDYNVDLINNSSSTITTDLHVSNLPEGWSHSLKSGTYTVERISILPTSRREDRIASLLLSKSVKKGRGMEILAPAKPIWRELPTPHLPTMRPFSIAPAKTKFLH